MWIIDWIPAFFTHTVLLISLAGFIICSFFNTLPFVRVYSKQIQILSVILLCGALYLEGGYAEKTKWETKLKDQEVLVAEYKAKSEQITVKEVIKYVDRQKIIYKKGQVIEKEIEKWRDRIDSNCNVPNAAIMLLDSSADKTIPGTPISSDASTKGSSSN